MSPYLFLQMCFLFVSGHWIAWTDDLQITGCAQPFFVLAAPCLGLVLCDWQFKWHGVISDPSDPGWSILKRRGENGIQKTMPFCCKDTFLLQFIKLSRDFCRHRQWSKYCQNVTEIIPFFVANWTQGIKKYIKNVDFFYQLALCVHICVGTCAGAQIEKENINLVQILYARTVSRLLLWKCIILQPICKVWRNV